MTTEMYMFAMIAFMYVFVGRFLAAFVKGRLPVGRIPAGNIMGPRNYVIGRNNGNVNPELLVKGRARWVSAAMGILLVCFSFALFDENALIVNALYSNAISVCIGLVVGWYWDKRTIRNV
jgi:hypothetical protein